MPARDVDDFARQGYCCIFCWQPWFFHLKRNRACPEKAWGILRGRQQR